MWYPDMFKNTMIQKMTGPDAISASALSKQVDVPQSTLSKWLRMAGVYPSYGFPNNTHEYTKMAPKEFRKNWARLIQKIHQVDPLLCPKCRDPMKVIGFIEDGEIIEKILRYLGLWETRSNDPPKSSNKPLNNRKGELTCDIAYSQLPPIDYWTQ